MDESRVGNYIGGFVCLFCLEPVSQVFWMGLGSREIGLWGTCVVWG